MATMSLLAPILLNELPGEGNFAQRKQLDTKWNLLSEVENTSYNSLAEAEDEEDTAHENN